jgi:hypothetical protein
VSLIQLLHELGYVGQAEQELQTAINEVWARSDTGDWHALRQLVDLLVDGRRLEYALMVLSARPSTSNCRIVEWLVAVLVEVGREEEALAVLRAWADDGDGQAALRLDNLLVERDRRRGTRTTGWSAASTSTPPTCPGRGRPRRIPRNRRPGPPITAGFRGIAPTGRDYSGSERRRVSLVDRCWPPRGFQRKNTDWPGQPRWAGCLESVAPVVVDNRRPRVAGRVQ